jgi:methylaspartate ammonia-lyase
MKDADTLMGAGVMKFGDGYAEILDICIKEEFADFALEYGMGKALLNAVDLKGIKNVVCNNTDIEKLLESLKFFRVSECGSVPDNLKENRYYLNLTGYFDANC